MLALLTIIQGNGCGDSPPGAMPGTAPAEPGDAAASIPTEPGPVDVFRAPAFSLVDLTVAFGGGAPFVTRLTRAGDFCGYFADHAEGSPFCSNVWTLTVTPHDELKGYIPIAVNARGVILARKRGLPPGPDVLDVAGTLQALPGPSARAVYAALNDQGECVGVAEPGDRAILYRDGQVLVLPGLLGNAINRNGEVAGVARGQDADGIAFTWSAGTILDLPTLGGFFTSPTDINDGGQVAGFGYLPTPSAAPQHAFFWDGRAMHDIGALPMLAGSESWATALNSRGDVVGSGRGGAFLYSRGVLFDLNEVSDTGGFSLRGAQSINDDGIILAYGSFPPELQLPEGAPQHLVALFPRR